MVTRAYAFVTYLSGWYGVPGLRKIPRAGGLNSDRVVVISESRGDKAGGVRPELYRQPRTSTVENMWVISIKT